MKRLHRIRVSLDTVMYTDEKKTSNDKLLYQILKEIIKTDVSSEFDGFTITPVHYIKDLPKEWQSEASRSGTGWGDWPDNLDVDDLLREERQIKQVQKAKLEDLPLLMGEEWATPQVKRLFTKRLAGKT